MLQCVKNSKSVGLMVPMAALLAMSQVAHADPVPRARLINCGEATCLRISGHRPSAAHVVNISGQEFAVEGERSWTATIPLEKARALSPGGDDMMVSLVNTQTGKQMTQVIELPPGALATHLSITKLVVRSH